VETALNFKREGNGKSFKGNFSSLENNEILHRPKL
jgi:hypothetical protein